MAREYWPHQLEAQEKARRLGSMGIFSGMRTGKTKITLGLILEDKLEPCLIVAPLSALSVWKEELKKEGVDPELIQIVRPKSGKIARTAKNLLLLPGKKYFILNYEQAENLDAQYLRGSWVPDQQDVFAMTGIVPEEVYRVKEWMDLPDWGCVVLDESYKIANFGNNITRYLTGGPVPVGQRRFSLSGTPAAEGPIQYAPHFMWMHGEYFGCKDLDEYIGKFWKWNEFEFKYKIKDVNHFEEIRQHVQKYSYCITMEELDLGCKYLRTSREVPANEEQKKLLEWLAYATVYVHPDTGEDMEMIAPVRRVKARQVAAGIDPNTRKMISDLKIWDFINFHKETGSKMLVSSFFVEPIYRACELMDQEGIKYGKILTGMSSDAIKQVEQDFHDGSIEIVIGQESKVSRALDFSPLDVIFIYSQGESNEAREQLEERGQHVLRKTPYEVISQHTENSIEESMTNVLTLKKEDARLYLSVFDNEIRNYRRGR